jgi:hypothetical protein
VLLALAVTACPAITAAQVIPDFSGIWMLDGSATAPWPTEPPYTTAGRQAQESWAAHPEDDPALLCVFQLWRIASAPLPHEIIQQDGRLTILYEYQHQVRRIFMGGRSHPEDEYPTLMGHSIGWWQGETLVIETTNVEDGYLRPQGYPHTSSAIFTQRDRLSDDGQRRQFQITIDDPDYYREPWTVTLNWIRTDEEIRDYDCIVRPHVPGNP